MFKHLKTFIIIIVLTFSFITCVNAQDVTIENANVSDIDFTFNGVTYNYEKIKNDINTHLSSCSKTLEDFDNFILRLPSQPSTSTSGNNGFYNTFQILLFNADVTSYYFQQSIQDSGLFDTNPRPLNYTVITWNMRLKNVTHNCNVSGSLSNFNGESSTKYFSYYSNVNWHNIDNMNANQSYPVYSKLFIDNSLFYTLPDYLEGYKKVDLTTNDKYIMISHVQSGSVYIPKTSFDTYGGLLSYYDNELSSQTYDSYIQDYTVMEDEQFVRQDFDLNNYYGADWVMFSKYLYLEGEDNVSYSIWVPNDSYDSQVTITPNNHGGNDFDYEYMDENGVVQNGQVSSVDLSQYSLEFNSKEGSIYKAKSLLVSLKDINYIWNSSFDTFYNNLPNMVQLFLIFFFNIIMILICLKLVGWKE